MMAVVVMVAIIACAPANRDAKASSGTTGTDATEANTTMPTNPDASQTTTASIPAPPKANTSAAPRASTSAASKESTAPAAKAKKEDRPMSHYENKVAELHTTAGEIDIRFFPEVAPNHVKNFIDLAEKGFYNGTKFHRVIPGFMIQGGDPNTVSGNTATWGTGGTGKMLAQEFNAVHHARGIVSMARSNDPNSASSQFFVCVADAGFLDKQYTVFGEVTKGMEVADKIVSAARNNQDRPNDPTAITKIVIRDAKPDERGPAPVAK
jgi:cyclophilin family peptidyl-prolyl cis-trans isomerase